MESAKNTPFTDFRTFFAPAQEKEQHIGAAFHKSSSEKSTSYRSPRTLVLPKTILVSLAVLIILTNIVVPVIAMDNQISMASYPVQNSHGISMANPTPGYPMRGFLVSTGTMAIVIVGYMVTMASQMLGPLMGITSVLWFIMRNDVAIRPSFSWSYVFRVF